MEDPNWRVAFEYDILVLMDSLVALSNQAQSRMAEKIGLDSLIVRRIVPDEEGNWNKLMADHHYLGFQTLTGPSLKYVAILNSRWVALVGWGGGVLKTARRDEWIGWSAEQKMVRLKYVVNNQRFLILPDVHIKNLASKVLALNIKRLSDDWQTVFGHPILLAETFVDHHRFQGTCYRAAGWKALGQTSGFGRKAGVYFYHGETKTILVKALIPEARQYLSAMFLPAEIVGKEKPPVDLNEVLPGRESDLLECLSRVSDPRMKRGIRHSLLSVLAVAVCAIMSGCTSFVSIGEWVADLSQDFLKRLGCRRHPDTGQYIAPSEPTLRRILQSVNGEEVDHWTCKWLSSQAGDGVIAVDGKVIHGSKHRNDKPFHLVSAFLQKTGITIAQTQVSDKSNEITAFEPLLRNLDLRGKVVTADAMHTQTKNARFLVEDKKADYVFQVKQNQQGLFDAIKGLSPQDWTPKITTADKGHGRIEVRSVQTTGTIAGKTDFPHVAQGIRVEREFTNLKTGHVSRDVAFYITSLAPDKADNLKFHDVIRGHWSIENRLHRVRDVTFGEDASLIGKGSAPRVLATLRNLAIGLFRLNKLKNIALALRMCTRNTDLPLLYIGL